MRKLHLVGYTPDLEGLIFTARRGSKSGGYIVAIEDALVDTIDEVRRRRNGDAPVEELPRPLSTPAGGARPTRPESILTPREIQARLRAGRSITQVAAEARVDPEWVEKFAVPILAEQAQMVELARASTYSKPRLGPSAQPLGVSVAWNLADRGVQFPEDVLAAAWTAHQLHDSVWRVRLVYRSRGRSQEATWELDVPSGHLVARNRLASELAHVEKGRRRRLPSRLQAAAAAAAEGDPEAGNDEEPAKPARRRRRPAKRVAKRRAARKVTTAKVGKRRAPAKSAASKPARVPAAKRAAKATTTKRAAKATPATRGAKAARAKRPAKARPAKRPANATAATQGATATPAKQPARAAAARRARKATTTKRAGTATPTTRGAKATPAKRAAKATTTKRAGTATPTKRPAKATTATRAGTATTTRRAGKATTATRAGTATPTKRVAKATMSRVSNDPVVPRTPINRVAATRVAASRAAANRISGDRAVGNTVTPPRPGWTSWEPSSPAPATRPTAVRVAQPRPPAPSPSTAFTADPGAWPGTKPAAERRPEPDREAAFDVESLLDDTPLPPPPAPRQATVINRRSVRPVRPPFGVRPSPAPAG